MRRNILSGEIGCEMLTAFKCLRLWPNKAFCVEDFEHWGFMKAGNVLVSIIAKWNKYHRVNEMLCS